MNKTLHTKFGTASLDVNGYYRIHSTTQGNFKKYLHRLIFEDFYGWEIPRGFTIHHKDENKRNNCILNLQLMRKQDHTSLHKPTEKIKVNMSKSKNSTGYFRVTKHKQNVAQGFIWAYQYSINHTQKKICSMNLTHLKEKILKKGFPWIVVDEDKARQTCEKYGYDFKELT